MVKYIVLICITSMFSCSNIKTLNTNSEKSIQQEKVFKKIVLEDNLGNIHRHKNVTVDEVTGTMNIKNSTMDKSVILSEFRSMRYSNKDYSKQGELIGGIVGLGFPVIYYLNNKGDTQKNSTLGSYNGLEILLSILTVPLGVMVGGAIGSQFYTDWQEFDLSPYRKDSISFGLKPMRNGFGIGLRIPLRK